MYTNLSRELFHKLLAEEPVFEDMRHTVEGNHYHREANVLVHTMMVCNWYVGHVDHTEDWYLLGLFTCLLHDVGKPICRVRKENALRGVYHSYDYHDVVGAKMATDILVRAGVSEFDIYRIAWMIDHHQIFWSVNKQDIKNTMANTLRSNHFYLPYKFFMLADSFGRIVDNHDRDYFKMFTDFERLL